MKILFFPASIIFLASCTNQSVNDSRVLNDDEVGRVSKEYSLYICKNTRIVETKESVIYRNDSKSFKIDFRNESCLESFYDGMQSNSQEISNVDGGEYGRYVGVLSDGKSQFVLNRMDAKSVDFFIRETDF